MDANLVDLVDAQNAEQYDTTNENEKSDEKLDTAQVKVANAAETCEDELNSTHSTSQCMLNDTSTHEANMKNLSYSSLRITPAKTGTAADDVITIIDDSSVIIVLDESHKENSVYESNQSIDPSKNLNKTYPEDKSFQDSKTNALQEKDSNKSSNNIQDSSIGTVQNESCVEILDDGHKKRVSLNQTSAFESSLQLEESLINTTQNKSCVEILDNDSRKRDSLNQTSAAFESSQHLEESLINTTQNKSSVEILDGNRKRANLNQSSAAIESSQLLEESLINTTQNKSSVEILDNDNRKRASLNQTSAAIIESSQHLEESLINTTQNKSSVEILDNDNRKRASLNQSSAAFESSQHHEESVINTTQNKSSVEILDDDNRKRAINQSSAAIESSQHLEESLINTTQNKLCVEIADIDNNERTSLNQTSSSASKSHSKHLEESYVLLDNDNRKSTSLNETPSAFESSQQFTTSVDLIDLNKTYPEEKSSDKVVADTQGSMVLLEEFANKDSTQSTPEIDQSLVNNSCSKIVHYQPNEAVGSDKNGTINVSETLPDLESSQKTNTNGSIDGSNDLNKTYQEEKSFLGRENTVINSNATYTTYEEEIEDKVDASKSTNLLNQTFSENSLKHNRNLNSTETDLVMALEALNINCEERDETFLSCHDAFEESDKEEDFESNNLDSGVHNCDLNTTFQSRKNASIDGEEIYDPETEKHTPNENDNCTENSFSESSGPTIQISLPGNENDNSKNEATSVNESPETNKNSSSETVIQDELATVSSAVSEVITPRKSLPKPRLSEFGNDDSLIDYNSLLEASHSQMSPSVIERRISMFLKQSDLKLYINQLEQKVSKLQIELCKKEGIIIKQQMGQNCNEECRKFEENNGQSETELIKKLNLELEEAKRKIAQMKIAHEGDVKKLNQKLSPLEEECKELQQINTELLSKLEKETSDKNKLIKLLDKSDSFVAYMSTRNKELMEEKTSLEKKLYDINTAFKEVIGKYEQCKVIIIGLKKNEEIYRREIDDLRSVLKRHEETYATFKKDATAKLKEASEQITTLQQRIRDAERANLPGKRRFN